MVKTAVIAVIVVAVVAVAAVGAFVLLSGNNDKDPNDVTFLIQDEDGVYFWIEGNGETALDALKDAFSGYPSGTLVTNDTRIISLFGNGTVSLGDGSYQYWMQYIWKDNDWTANTFYLGNTKSDTVDYMLIVYSISTGSGTAAPEGTPVPKDKAVWNGDTKGTVFQIESDTGLYFKINGTGGNTLLETFKNACNKYKIPIETATFSTGDCLSGIFGITSSQDAAGNWLWWNEYEYKSGAWESSVIGMAGLKSSDNPKYALVFGNGTGTPA